MLLHISVSTGSSDSTSSPCQNYLLSETEKTFQVPDFWSLLPYMKGHAACSGAFCICQGCVERAVIPSWLMQQAVQVTKEISCKSKEMVCTHISAHC